MRTPVRSRHSRASVQGQGAAPETARRRLERSVAPRAGDSRMRWNIVATPGKTVARCRAIARSVSSGAKRSCSTTVTPASSGASSAPFRPKEWASGSTASTRSSGPRPMTGPAHDSLATASAAWESTAPFGWPVLPEV